MPTWSDVGPILVVFPKDLSKAEIVVMKGWLVAIRPKTLWLSQGPVLVGAAFALHNEVWQPSRLLLASLFALFLQMGANMANDLYDGLRGVDTPNRVGPVRALQAGMLKVRSLQIGLIVVVTCGMVCSLIAGYVAHRPLFFVLGPICALMAWGYTGFSLANRGLGELMALFFFGLVATGGTYLVITGHNSQTSQLLGLSVGCMAAAVMLLNNLRDQGTDAAAGKKTLVLRLGDRSSRYLLLVLVLGALAPLCLFGIWYVRLAAVALFALRGTGPLMAALRGAQGADLNPPFFQMAKLAPLHALMVACLVL
jgi:1,4-dihydroxy-2-naphthoate polyprenyltransferase